MLLWTQTKYNMPVRHMNPFTHKFNRKNHPSKVALSVLLRMWKILFDFPSRSADFTTCNFWQAFFWIAGFFERSALRWLRLRRIGVKGARGNFKEKPTKTRKLIKSAKYDRNKEITDFNLRKSAAIFAKKLHKLANLDQNRVIFCIICWKGSFIYSFEIVVFGNEFDNLLCQI